MQAEFSLGKPQGIPGTDLAKGTLKPAVPRLSPGSLPVRSSPYTLINQEWPMIIDHRSRTLLLDNLYTIYLRHQGKVLSPGANWRAGGKRCAQTPVELCDLLAPFKLHGCRQVTSQSEWQLPNRLWASSCP